MIIREDKRYTGIVTECKILFSIISGRQQITKLRFYVLKLILFRKILRVYFSDSRIVIPTCVPIKKGIFNYYPMLESTLTSLRQPEMLILHSAIIWMEKNHFHKVAHRFEIDTSTQSRIDRRERQITAY